MANDQIEKVVRDGKVAVLYSPGFGAGWYTWNPDYPQCIFHPQLIEIVEKGQQHLIDDDFMKSLLSTDSFYCDGAGNLKICWLNQGTHFNIDEYDGSESIVTFEDIKLIA